MRNTIRALTRRHSPVLLLLLTIGACALAPVTDSIAGPASGSGSQDSGARLLLKHSVTLGINIAVSVTIDGQEAGVFAKGHIFDVPILPGSHVVSVKPYGREIDAWTGRVNVRPGEMLAFLVKYRGDEIVLAPVG